jgi:hypothetical protein
MAKIAKILTPCKKNIEVNDHCQPMILIRGTTIIVDNTNATPVSKLRRPVTAPTKLGLTISEGIAKTIGGVIAQKMPRNMKIMIQYTGTTGNNNITKAKRNVPNAPIKRNFLRDFILSESQPKRGATIIIAAGIIPIIEAVKSLNLPIFTK